MPESTLPATSVFDPDPRVKAYYPMSTMVHERFLASMVACPRYRAELERLHDARGRIASIRAAGRFACRAELATWERVEQVAAYTLAVLLGEAPPPDDGDIDESIPF